MPCSLCGLAGLRPTVERISGKGFMPRGVFGGLSTSGKDIKTGALSADCCF